MKGNYPKTKKERLTKVSRSHPIEKGKFRQKLNLPFRVWHPQLPDPWFLYAGHTNPCIQVCEAILLRSNETTLALSPRALLEGAPVRIFSEYSGTSSKS